MGKTGKGAAHRPGAPGADWEGGMGLSSRAATHLLGQIPSPFRCPQPLPRVPPARSSLGTYPAHTAGSTPVSLTAATPAPRSSFLAFSPTSPSHPTFPTCPRGRPRARVVGIEETSCCAGLHPRPAPRDRRLVRVPGSGKTVTAGRPDDLTRSSPGCGALIYVINSGPQAGKGNGRILNLSLSPICHRDVRPH